MIQGSNKLKNYRFRWLSKPLRLAKFESFWIQVCAIVAISRIPGDISLFSFEFDRVLLMVFFYFFLFFYFYEISYYSLKNSSLLPVAFPPFYSVMLGSRGTIDSPVLLPGYQSPFCAHHPEGWVFLCFSYFPPFGAVSSKAHANFPFRSALVHNFMFLIVQLLAVLPLCHFSKVSGIQLC